MRITELFMWIGIDGLKLMPRPVLPKSSEEEESRDRKTDEEKRNRDADSYYCAR